MNRIETALLSRADVLEVWANDIELIIKSVEDGFRAYSSGQVILPEKSSQIFDENSQSRINCMPSTVLSMGVAGVKWVSVFPNNPSLYNINNVGGVMVLSEIESGQTLAIIAASALTALRTAAVDALAARYLSPEKVESVAILGTGQQAEFHARFLAPAGSGIQARVAGRNANHVTKLVHLLRSEGVEAIDFGCRMEEATRSSQVIVTAISGQDPILKASWISKGTLYCHVGGWEDEFDVARKADLIVCDNWQALKHRGSPTIARMYEKGLISDADIYADLPEIIDGKIPGRLTDDQFIYFNAIGLSCIDVAVANCLLARAKRLGKYRKFKFD